MLPSRFLDCERTDDGRVVPRWLLSRDDLWLRELVHEAGAVNGRPAFEADERIVGTVAPVARRHGAARMRLSGPLALFHDTVKYGNALARWFPALVATHGWSLHARVVFRGETLRFDLDAGSPLPRTHAMPKAHDSRIEASLEADLRRMASEWRIKREAAVVRVASSEGGRPRLFFPDFALSSERGRVLVEVAGYWTKEYIEDKRAMMHAARVPLVMCIDERHADPEFREDPCVIVFKKRIDVHSLLGACERALATIASMGPATAASG